MAFELAPLPYDYNSLEPYIDTMTMQIHHDKHHGAYVTNLNKALENAPDFQNKSVEELLMNLEALPEAVRTAVRNNGGGHYNHTMFWQIMGPTTEKPEEGDWMAKVAARLERVLGNSSFRQAVQNDLGGSKTMIEQVNAAGMGRFGSGWSWVVMNKDGKLSVMSTPNQDNPMSVGLAPVFGIDVWEHAYYLHYQNRRADYLNAWWNVVNWEEIANRYNMCRKIMVGS